MLDYNDKIAILNEFLLVSSGKKSRYDMYMHTKSIGYKKIAKNFNGENVLELGSDESPTSSILVRWSSRLTVVDMFDKFTKKVDFDQELKRASFILAKWEEFEPKEPFSDIVLTDSLEHVDDPVYILSLCRKWLADNGRLHIIVPNALSFHRLIGAKMGYLKSPYDFNQNDIDSGHLRVYDIDILNNDIRQAGLLTEHIYGIQFKPMSDTQLSDFPDEYLVALEDIGDLFARNCAEIYACCKK